MLQSHFGEQSVVCGIPCHTLNNAMVGDDDELFYLTAVRNLNDNHFVYSNPIGLVAVHNILRISLAFSV